MLKVKSELFPQSGEGRVTKYHLESKIFPFRVG